MTIGFAMRHIVRSRAAAVAAIVLGVAIFGATPQAPAGATTPSCVVPFLAAGSSALVAGVTTVSATENLAQQVSTYPGVDSAPFTDFQYYFSTPTRSRIVLTFSPAVSQVAVDPAYNNDSPNRPTTYERFTIKVFDAGAQVGATVMAQNSDVTVVVGNGTTDSIVRIEIDYDSDLSGTAHTDTTHAGTTRASLLNVLLPGTCAPTLGPSAQSISGTTSQPLAATAAMSAAGFGGAVTYAVTSGSLPAGLTLNTATGVISGTPTGVGASTVTITGTGGTSGSATATVSFTISEPTPTPAEPTPQIALDCTPDPVAPGGLLTCTLTGGVPSVDVLWRVTLGEQVIEGVVVAGEDGTAQFSVLVPRSIAGATTLTAELVDWTRPVVVSVTDGAGGPIGTLSSIPTSVPTGGGPRPTPAVLLNAMLVAVLIAVMAFGSVGPVVAAYRGAEFPTSVLHAFERRTSAVTMPALEPARTLTMPGFDALDERLQAFRAAILAGSALGGGSSPSSGSSGPLG